MLWMTASPVMADTDCKIGRTLSSFGWSKVEDSPESQWIEYKRIDAVSSGARTASKDEPIFAADLTRFADASVMAAPNDFTFRSRWPLNPDFTFRQGVALPLAGVFEPTPGEKVYVLAQGDEKYVFAREDGTLCNKVLNTRGEIDVFVIKEFASDPKTKLTLQTRVTDRNPVTLKVLYLGATGGIATFRAIWSREGRILETDDQQYDQGATKVAIGGLSLPVSDLTATTVQVGDIPLTEKIAWDAYWARWFKE